MIKRLEITEDLLKVIPIIYLQENVRGIDDKTITIDSNHLYNVGMHLLEDLSMALDIYDHAIKGTEDDPDGRAFNEEDTERMLSLHKYVVDNIYYLETLIHQYAVKGGLEVGVYKAKDNELIWEKCD